ncbi:MAG: 16S rRNA (guanine(966)-N(2))-methyltransferase RsmD [Actinomycetota bacterium]
MAAFIVIRVIAGEAKGRKLRTLHAATLRPSADRVKEAMFSSLGERVVEAEVLDLYAGSGALGIEALSRGATHVTFVDVDQKAVDVIESNLAATRFSQRATVICADAGDFSPPGDERQISYGLVLVDPPYVLGLPSDVLLRLQTRAMIDPTALVVLEASSKMLPIEPPTGWTVVNEKRYGDTALVYLRIDQA